MCECMYVCVCVCVLLLSLPEWEAIDAATDDAVGGVGGAMWSSSSASRSII